MSKKQTYWVSSAFKEETAGRLRRQLQMPKGKNIPITLLQKIKNSDIGTRITNPTKTGKKRLTVTRLLKKRAVLAHSARGFKHKKEKK